MSCLKELGGESNHFYCCYVLMASECHDKALDRSYTIALGPVSAGPFCYTLFACLSVREERTDSQIHRIARAEAVYNKYSARHTVQ